MRLLRHYSMFAMRPYTWEPPKLLRNFNQLRCGLSTGWFDMSCWARLLLEALQDRDEALARQALARGATFEEINEVGDTPLLLACRSGSSNIAKELIQRQANLEARDRRHRFAALHLVSARGGLGGSWFCRFAEALDDLETAAHQVRLRQRGYSLLRFLGLEREEDSVPTLEAPLLARSTRFHPRDMTPKAKMVLQMRGRFMSLLNDSLGYVKEHPNQEGVALFHQRITMALNIIGDADQPAQVLAAVKAIRRLFPFEVDPLDDMPFLAVYMCSLRIRWSYFLLCALFTALALFAGTITELFFAVFADGDKLDFQAITLYFEMVITVATMSLKMAWTFPDIAGPFYTVILIFFVSAALGLQVGGAFSLAPKAAVEPLMNSRPGDEPLLPLKAVATIVGQTCEDMAALALIAYEENCDEMDRLLKESFGKRSPRLEHCSSYSELPRWVAVRFSPTHGIGCGTRVFALKGTSSWRDVYADIKLFATIEVLQALSKIVPILSLLPVALVQGIVGYTGNADAHDAIIASEKDRSDATVLTGHSLGGCIAQIVAARPQLPALVFSSPGVLYSARRARHVVVVVPDGDVIATVDEHAGVVQRIACFKKNGQAASTATCHRLRKTACEVWRACGDAWGRDFSTTCGGYVSPDLHLLLEQRAEVEVTGREGETPVHLASLMGHAKVLDLLLEASASPNILAIDGKGARIPRYCEHLTMIRRTWALKLMMLTHHGVITPLALWSMWEDPVIRQLYSCIGCKEAARLMNRAAGVPPLAARALTPVTLGYFTADLLLLSQWDLTKGSKLEFYLMLVHHIASMLVWPAAIYFDWVARYVIIMLSYESTSLLLTLLWLINAAGYKKSSLYVVTGLLFTCLFIALRLLGAVPQVIAMYWVPPWSATVLEAEGGIHRLASLCCRSLVLPHVMNLFWGAKVVEGQWAQWWKSAMCALSHACYRGHLEVVQSLLLYKAVDRPDAGQRRGLHWAAQHGHEAILDILLPSSINAQEPTIFFRAMLQHLRLSGRLHTRATALSLAAQRGHLEVVRQLVEANAELDLQGCDGETALMLASLNGHLEVVQYLVQANADLMITAKDGFDALRLAAEAEQLEVMQQLLLLGAEVPPEGLLLPQDASCSEDLVLTKSLAKQLLVERAVAGDDALARQWGFNGNGQQLLDAVSRAGCEVPQETDPPGANPAIHGAKAVPKAPEKTAGGTEVKSQKEQGENPWTLVWISDQAFKPTAVSLKTQLESLGCQVKGYKTNKNAARALDKKRGLVRTVVMVTAAEALPFLQYLSSRPELASTPVVVEATRGYGSIPKSPSVQVCESFDAAAKAEIEGLKLELQEVKSKVGIEVNPDVVKIKMQARQEDEIDITEAESAGLAWSEHSFEDRPEDANETISMVCFDRKSAWSIPLVVVFSEAFDTITAAVILIFNLIMQSLFISIISGRSFLGEDYSNQVDDAASWRRSFAHDSKYVDTGRPDQPGNVHCKDLTDRSLASRVCNEDGSLIFSNGQTEILTHINAFLGMSKDEFELPFFNPGVLLSVLCILLWNLCIFKEYRSIWHALQGMYFVPKASRTVQRGKGEQA
eukprot:g1570.t1